MRRKDLFALAALILLMLFPLLRAAEAYRPGDRVVLIDADGDEHLADIMGTAENGWYSVCIDGDPYEFPPKSIQGKAGWRQRLAAAFTESSQAVKTYGSAAAGVAAIVLGRKVQLASDKDTDQTDTTAAAAQAQQIAENTLRSGTIDNSRYYISGTFSGPQAFDGNGAWTPSITLATNSDGLGGNVLIATVSNKPGGSPQTQEGIGTWGVLGKGTIVIRGLPAPYGGDAKLDGITPYGVIAYQGSGSIRLASGATLTGGTIQSGNPPDGQ